MPKRAKKGNGVKEVYIVPTANIYIKGLDLHGNRNVPLLVRADVGKNIVENLKLARYPKKGEIKSMEEEKTPSSEVTENAADN